jgi:hypothetical protein
MKKQKVEEEAWKYVLNDGKMENLRRIMGIRSFESIVGWGRLADFFIVMMINFVSLSICSGLCVSRSLVVSRLVKYWFSELLPKLW